MYFATFIKGAVHKRRRQLGGGEGSKIGQNCRRIVLKTANMGEVGVKNPEKLLTSFMDGSLLHFWAVGRSENLVVCNPMCFK